MKSIPAAAFAIGIFVFGALALPIIGPFSFLTASIAEAFDPPTRSKSSVPESRRLDKGGEDSLDITTLGTPVTYDFNGLSQSGTTNPWADNTTVAGFYAQFSAVSTNPTTYIASGGASTTGGIHSMGVNGVGPVSDRAFGSVASTTTGDIYFALRLTNSTGGAITSIDISFVGEQWRAAGCTAPACVPAVQKLDFQYQVATVGTVTDANTPSTGWVDHDPLDFASPTPGESSAAILDGNIAANRTAKSATLTVNVPNGQEIWLRWRDVNDASNDHALAIDDLSVTPNGATTNPGAFSFDPTSYSPGEGDGAATITVRRNGGTDGSVTVDYGATGVSATAGATCGFGTGVDYVTPSGTLTFADGVDTQTFNVTVCDDQLVEVTESLDLSLSNPTGGATIGTGAATVNILDNDVSVQFASAAFAKREGSTVSITITRSGLTDAPATANYSVSGGNATGGTCGTAGVDFATPSGSVEFAIGETSKNIDIEICSDAAAENPNETFDLTIDTASGASVGSPSTTSVSILEPLGRAMWVFGGSVVPNPVSDAGGRSTLVGRSYQAGVRELYVSVYQGTPNSNGRLMYQDSDMAALNSLADSTGQEVWAAYGDTNWPGLTAGCPGSSFPEARMAEVAAFNASRPANERFDGVMLDVEPSPSNEAEFQALIAHYECMRSRLPAEIKLGVAISAFWDDDVIEYPAAFAMSSKPVSSHIIDLPLDRVVVMGYRDSAGTDVCPTSNGMICLDKDEIAYASSIGKAGLVFAGLETMALPGEDNVTFNEEGQITMEAEAGLVDTYFNASSGLGGFAIHNYTAAYLGGSSGWPVGPTAAPASISGRVTTSRGAGIRGVTIIVQDLNTGISRTTATSTFGYYRITGLSAGQAYIVTASSRRYTSAAGSQLVNLDDNVDGVDFIASP